MVTEIVNESIASLYSRLLMEIIVAAPFIIGSIIVIYIKYPSKIKWDFVVFAGGIF